MNWLTINLGNAKVKLIYLLFNVSKEGDDKHELFVNENVTLYNNHLLIVFMLTRVDL